MITDKTLAVAALVTALERAEEGSGELDIAITKVIKGDGDAPGTIREYKVERGEAMFRYQCPGFAPDWSSWWEVEPYTTSLDAALSLVPDGWAATAAFTTAADRRSFFRVAREATYEHPSAGATPALALCIAALKARAEREARREATTAPETKTP